MNLLRTYRDGDMLWYVSYSADDEIGFRAIRSREAAIRTACDLLDKGYVVLRVGKSGHDDYVPPHEIAFARGRRNLARLQ